MSLHSNITKNTFEIQMNFNGAQHVTISYTCLLDSPFDSVMKKNNIFWRNLM